MNVYTLRRKPKQQFVSIANPGVIKKKKHAPDSPI